MMSACPSTGRRCTVLRQSVAALLMVTAFAVAGCRGAEPAANGAPPAITMIRVQSSAMTAIGYDPHTCTLRIRFIQDADYDYSGIPLGIYRGLLSAESHGKYYHKHIKSKYPSKRVR